MNRRRAVQALRKRNALAYIGVEGTSNKTEKYYFNGFGRNNKLYRIKTFSLGKTDPVGMVRDMINKLGSDSEFDAKRGDRAFVVFDIDNNPAKDTQIQKARALAASHGIQLVPSNPCIEFWFLLHFSYINAHLNSYDEVKRRLLSSGRLPSYAKNQNDIWDCLKDHTAVAMNNAAKLRRFHLENGCKDSDLGLSVINPYTEIDLLVEILVAGLK